MGAVPFPTRPPDNRPAMLTFNGLACQDVAQEVRSCAAAGVPTEPWRTFANRFTHPVGLLPGRGYLLLGRAAVNKLDAGARGKLVFGAFPVGDNPQTLTLANVRAVGTPQALTPGLRDDEATLYLVEVADRRIDCVGLANKRYNWRLHPDAPYEKYSTYDGATTAWTWTQVLTDLWNAVGNLGSWPGLPRTPAGTPEQIDATAQRAADVLEDLLLLNGMGVKYDPVNDTFSIVDFAFGVDVPARGAGWAGGVAGAATQALADLNLVAVGQALFKYDAVRLWDAEPLVAATNPLPQYARVAFPCWAPGLAPADTATYAVVDVADPNPDGQTQKNTYSLIQDWFPCRMNQVGAALNLTDLVTRATEVAKRFFERGRKASFWPIHRVYSGIIADANLMPGAAIDVIVWEDGLLGARTALGQTGRLGFAPLVKNAGDGPFTAGTLKTGHPSSTWVRNGAGLTQDVVRRAGGVAPGELRERGTGPLSDHWGSKPTDLIGGASNLLVHVGPLRQWDNAVQARSVDGQGQRLWKPRPRAQWMCVVKVTSTTPTSSMYPAQEQFIDPATRAVTTGDTVWFYDPNGATPASNSFHLAYLDGTDGGSPAKKVYVASDGRAADPCGYSLADFTKIPGYTTGVVQLLGHTVNDCWHWFDTANCASGSGSGSGSGGGGGGITTGCCPGVSIPQTLYLSGSNGESATLIYQSGSATWVGNSVTPTNFQLQCSGGTSISDWILGLTGGTAAACGVVGLFNPGGASSCNPFSLIFTCPNSGTVYTVTE